MAPRNVAAPSVAMAPGTPGMLPGACVTTLAHAPASVAANTPTIRKSTMMLTSTIWIFSSAW